jgi:ankyrin repeat protein
VAIEHDGVTLLSRAVSDNSLSLLRASFRYRDRFSAELQIAACALACGSDKTGLMLEFLEHWDLEVESRDSAGHSFLWIAVAECKMKIVRLFLKRGANVGSSCDLLSPKELAF